MLFLRVERRLGIGGASIVGLAVRGVGDGDEGNPAVSSALTRKGREKDFDRVRR